ncbi:hypothetical protein Drorol1_Dr00007722 [Drosera rotundifolia]
MAASLKRSDSKNMYSWWWDSHRPKNSKWLMDNLKDMDSKVKVMIKLIEEDADSFARRAEMYYKKRPELMKLVEEFYRAYRALAERYDHATGELRQAHKRIAQAFPDELPFMMADDATSSSDSLLEDFDGSVAKKGLMKQLNNMFQSAEEVSNDINAAEEKLRKSMEELEKELAKLSNENESLKTRVTTESGRAGHAETELRNVKESLAKTEVERDAALQQSQQCLDKLHNLEKALNHALKDAADFERRASEAESEIKVLKQALLKLEVEKDSALRQYRESMNQVASLETLISVSKDGSRELNHRAIKAETECKILKEELSRSEAEKEASRLLYEQCLEKISALENKLLLSEGKAKVLSEQNVRSKNEVEALEKQILSLKQESEAATLRYEHCLNKISILQKELTEAQEECKRLNGEIFLGSTKLRGVEEQCALLGKVNQSLQLEANNLAQEIAVKDQELSLKQAELEKLQNSLQDEQSQFMQVETTLQALQEMHSRSQEEHRALAIELQNGIRLLKDLETEKRDMEAEIQQLTEENQSLNEQTLASSISEQNLQKEIASLREMKARLEGEVERQGEQTVTLEQQVHHLKDQMTDLCRRYQDLISQVESAGLEPTALASSVRGLQEENTKLRGSCSMERSEREALVKKLELMEDLLRQSSILESSLSDLTGELGRSKDTIKVLQDSSLLLTEEKSALIAEKTALLSQLQTMADSMQKILEQNVLLENSLAGANAELEGVRANSKSLEEFCQLLSCERSRLLNEREDLISRLETVEQKLENLEKRFILLEDRYMGLQKEKQSTVSQVEELRASLDIEKHERACLILASEARFSGLEDHINQLQEENRSRKEDFEEQLDKAVKAQVEVFILQRFMQDIEVKNHFLFVECQKHVEEAKHSEILIEELEGEKMMYQAETEFLLGKIENLRTGILQILKALGISHAKEAETEQNLVLFVLSKIEETRSSLSECKDENQQLVIENSVLTTLLGQLNMHITELISRFAQEISVWTRRHVMLENEKHELLERNKSLELKVVESEKGEEAMKAELDKLQMERGAMQMEHAALKQDYLKVVEGNQIWLQEFSELEEENHDLEEGVEQALLEALDFSVQVVVLKSWGIDKALNLDSVSQNMGLMVGAYNKLELKTGELELELEMKGLENLHLTESVQKLEEKQHELSSFNSDLNHQAMIQQELLNQKESELSRMHEELKSACGMNTELKITIEVVEKEREDLKAVSHSLEETVIELSDQNERQDEEIKKLQAVNHKLEAEVGLLKTEVEEYRTIEEVLSLELQERNSASELWEAEAASFYFDLQISGIKEVIFQNKVQELSGTCEDLEALNRRKCSEIEQMKDIVRTLESQVEVLKTQLAAYNPIIVSLKDNIASLEENAALHKKLHLDLKAEQVADERRFSALRDQTFVAPDGLLELQKLQDRIKKVDEILVEGQEVVARRESMNTNSKLQGAMKEIVNLTARIYAHSGRYTHGKELQNGAEVVQNLQSPESGRETGPETSESRTGTELKDVQLDLTSDCSSDGTSKRQNGQTNDHMLKLWEAVEKEYANDMKINRSGHQACFSEVDEILYHEFEIGDENSLNPTAESQLVKDLGVDKLVLSRNVSYGNQEGTMKSILEKLATDANKLMELQFSVQELRAKMETSKKSSKEGEYDRLKTQLVDVENSVMQLVDTNTEVMKSVEDRPSTSDTVASTELDDAEKAHRRRVLKQVQRGSEKIGRLQLEVQKIQFVLLKLDGERNSPGRRSFSRSRPGILLRDLVYNNGSGRRRKKSRFCGCLRPSSKEN